MKIATWVVEDTLGELAYWDLIRVYGDDECLALVGHGSRGQLRNDLEEARDDTVWAEQVDLIEELLHSAVEVGNEGSASLYYWPTIQVTEDE